MTQSLWMRPLNWRHSSLASAPSPGLYRALAGSGRLETAKAPPDFRPSGARSASMASSLSDLKWASSISRSGPSAAGGPLLEMLEAHFKSLSDEAMLADLAPLGLKSGGALAVSNLPEPANALYKPGDGADAKLECRQFKGRIQRDWVISSFTYFRAGLPDELPDRDGGVAPAKEEAPGEGFFPFPRGAKAGTCLHEMLEKLDFHATDEEMFKLVGERLQAHGLAQSGNSEAVQQMLKALLQFPLASGRKDFTLDRKSTRLNSSHRCI